MNFDSSNPNNVVRLNQTHIPSDVDERLVALLTERPRKLHTSLSYDPDGSALFEELCRQPEYYLTRTEVGLLHREAARLVEASNPDRIADLGCGNFEKTQIILHEAVKRKGTVTFYPCDIDEGIILESVPHLEHFYRDTVHTQAIVGTFEDSLDYLANHSDSCLYAFIGGTFGNLTGAEQASLLRAVAASMQSQDTFLLAVDLVKSPQLIEAAYNDAAGCVRRAMLRMLVNLNEQYGANFDPTLFEHESRYFPEEHTVASYLKSKQKQTIRIERLDLTLDLDEGEEIEAEIRQKFVLHEVLWDLTRYGLTPTRMVADEQRPYALILCRRTLGSEYDALRAVT